MANQKDLISTLLSGPRGSSIEVKKGAKLYLINPEVCEDPTSRRSQKYMNERLVNELGKPPYTLNKITFYFGSGKTLLDIEGEKGKKEGITEEYFTAD